MHSLLASLGVLLLSLLTTGLALAGPKPVPIDEGPVRLVVKLENEAGESVGTKLGKGTGEIFSKDKKGDTKFLKVVKYQAEGINNGAGLPKTDNILSGELDFPRDKKGDVPASFFASLVVTDAKTGNQLGQTFPLLDGMIRVVNPPQVQGADLRLAENGTRIPFVNNLFLADFRLIGVPEPTTAMLAGLGLLGMLAATRRCRRPVH